MDGKMDKRKLLRSIRDTRSKLEETVDAVPQERLTVSGVEGPYSVKDLLAHISIWERRMIRWLSETLQDKEPEMLPEGMTWDDLDRWNEQTFLELRDQTLEHVLDEFRASYRDALIAVEAAPEDDLIDPDRFAWRQGRALWELVSANMDWHYVEHEETIRTWLESTSGT